MRKLSAENEYIPIHLIIILDCDRDYRYPPAITNCMFEVFQGVHEILNAFYAATTAALKLAMDDDGGRGDGNVASTCG